MQVTFEHNFQRKVMQQSFAAPTTINSDKDITTWRMQWMGELKSWHSPYSLLLDCSNLFVAEDSEAIKNAFSRMIKFFEGFFLKKIVAFGWREGQGHEFLPISILQDEDQAFQEVGLKRAPRESGGAVDFRSQIQIQNHFRQHCVEVTFSDDTQLDSTDKMQILRSKLTNNLMQWHSKWNLLIDCTNLTFAAGQHEEFEKMCKFFRGLFLKQVVGYGSADKTGFPFTVYRARHKAAAMLEGEGNSSGDEAECRSNPKVGSGNKT